MRFYLQEWIGVHLRLAPEILNSEDVMFNQAPCSALLDPTIVVAETLTVLSLINLAFDVLLEFYLFPMDVLNSSSYTIS